MQKIYSSALLLFVLCFTTTTTAKAANLKAVNLDDLLEDTKDAISDYKYSLGAGIIGGGALTLSAYKIYKQDAIKNNLPWSKKDFIKKYPKILMQGLTGKSRKFRKEHPWFCKAVKAYAFSMPFIIGYEYKKRTKITFRSDYITLPKELTQHLLTRCKNVRILRRSHIQYTNLPTNTKNEVIAERKKEELLVKKLKNTILIEQNYGCLFCHATFKNNDYGCYYGCNPADLYHPKCIIDWEKHDNNGYYHGARAFNKNGTARPYPNPHGCHNDCDAGNTGNKNKRPPIYIVKIKLRASQTPGFFPLESVNNGILKDPKNNDGTIVRTCNVCNKSFKNGDNVAFAHLHPQCGTNHIVHAACMRTFRNTFDEGNSIRGTCWVHRGISCPYRCTHPTNYGFLPDGNDKPDPAPVLATVQFTTADTTNTDLLKHPLLKGKKTIPLTKIMRCQGCGHTSDKHKNRYWTEIQCCGTNYEYCGNSHTTEDGTTYCLPVKPRCAACYNPLPENTVKTAQWYHN